MTGLIPALVGLAVVLALTPLGIRAIGLAKRFRGGAAAITSLMLVFGINMQITPPPPPRTEQVQKESEKAPDGEPKG